MRRSEKTNEIPVAQAVLPLLLAQRGPGRVVTADALHTQTAFVAAVRAQGGHVILTLKENQPTLAADLALLFADPLTTVRRASTRDLRRGRDEQRTLELTTDLTTFLATASPWPHRRGRRSPKSGASPALSRPHGVPPTSRSLW